MPNAYIFIQENASKMSSAKWRQFVSASVCQKLLLSYLPFATRDFHAWTPNTSSLSIFSYKLENWPRYNGSALRLLLPHKSSIIAHLFPITAPCGNPVSCRAFSPTPSTVPPARLTPAAKLRSNFTQSSWQQWGHKIVQSWPQLSCNSIPFA